MTTTPHSVASSWTKEPLALQPRARFIMHSKSSRLIDQDSGVAVPILAEQGAVSRRIKSHNVYVYPSLHA